MTVTDSVSVDPWDMMNNFCFHVYAQMPLFRDDAKTARSPMGGRGVIKNPRIGHKRHRGKGDVGL